MTGLPKGYRIEKITQKNKEIISAVTEIHVKTFKGFFLTFMGKGFLRKMYLSYVLYKDSGILFAYNGDNPVGFLAYSSDMSGLYKYMLKHGFISFVYYAFLAFIRRPKAFFKLFGALNKSEESEREEKYLRISSIGVLPTEKGKGLGSALINALKGSDDFKGCEYISLETDADNNDKVNAFYCNNGFTLFRSFTTRENRKMNEYRLYK